MTSLPVEDLSVPLANCKIERADFFSSSSSSSSSFLRQSLTVSPGWPRILHVDQASLELIEDHLPLPPEIWG